MVPTLFISVTYKARKECVAGERKKYSTICNFQSTIVELFKQLLSIKTNYSK